MLEMPVGDAEMGATIWADVLHAGHTCLPVRIFGVDLNTRREGFFSCGRIPE